MNETKTVILLLLRVNLFKESNVFPIETLIRQMGTATKNSCFIAFIEISGI